MKKQALILPAILLASVLASSTMAAEPATKAPGVIVPGQAQNMNQAQTMKQQESPMKTEYINIGSRLELFVDRYLIDKLDGAELVMHSPEMAPLSLSPIVGYYMTVIKDGDLYRAYYRGFKPGYKASDGDKANITLYAESKNGKDWQYPELNLYKVSGAGAVITNLSENGAMVLIYPEGAAHPEGAPVIGKSGNNIILADEKRSANFIPFLDKRPGVPPAERFKALGGLHPDGLFAFISGDGIHWKKMADGPVITSKDFAFDSDNIAFWSESENVYVCYFRTWIWHTPQGDLRSISRTTSPDFLNWSKAVPLNPNLPGEQLYTSNTHPYFRAPHIYVAFPTRLLSGRGDSTDILFMSSRGGAQYDRLFLEAFIRPGLDPARWGNRSNYVALNVVPTGPDEMSIYSAMSGYRYVLRTDGFVSVNAGHGGGQMITKPFTFSGKELVLNYSTSAAGSVGVEIQSADGRAVPGFGLADCKPLIGDKIEEIVSWQKGNDVSSLAGKPVRLRFALNDADLYSMRFR